MRPRSSTTSRRSSSGWINRPGASRWDGESRLIGDLLDDSLCQREAGGALRIVDAALGERVFAAAGARVGVQLLKSRRSPGRRQAGQIDAWNVRRLGRVLRASRLRAFLLLDRGIDR